MGFSDRPFVGSYNLTGKRLVQYTPDCLVYINGDTSLPGCHRCHGRIDMQQFITSVSVDASTQPGGGSSSISMSVPRDFTDSLFRDNNFLIFPGLEVHVYMRGYFPMKGMFTPREQGAGELIDIGGINLSDMVVYPYYHVFHGVVTNVSKDYSGGFWHASFSCQDMLHFWQYQPIGTIGALVGQKVNGKDLITNKIGATYNQMSPYSIIYDLYRRVLGSPAAVGGSLVKDHMKSNVAAVNPYNPEQSMFSLVQLYWEKRFQTRMNNLRMYGASGQLYNSAQQAFLTRLQTTPQLTSPQAAAQRAEGDRLELIQSVEGERLDFLQLQYKDPSQWSNKERDVFKDLFMTARGLGFLRYGPDGELEKGMDLIQQARDPEARSTGGVPDMGLNIAAIHAFTGSPDTIAQVSEFEATYETKIDIANKVAEVTGFEFYQDVDGDFVFKPPFYNMDISNNRIYRLEDIDLISFSAASREPEVTYMIAKAGHFTNQVIGGVENENGVQARIVDYRLVAQFGYRPGSFESSYYNNPNALYWAAMNRMDVMNASIHSASTTIPLRPELRVGYPVYIQSEDSYYYVNGLNHSFQYGGQCTTSLTLEARRSKFNAPGNPSKRGIDSIDLGNPSLPPKPLEVLAEDGQPRLTGFPNVVMALDPDQINPLHYVIGLPPESVSSKRYADFLMESLRMMGELEVDVNDLKGVPTAGLEPGTRVKLRVGEDNAITFQPQDSGEHRPLLSEKEFKEQATRYADTSSEVARATEDKSRKLKELEQKQASIERDGSLSAAERQAQLLALGVERRTLETSTSLEQSRVENPGDRTNNTETFLTILKAVRGAYLDGYQSEITDANSTANLLEVLSDKKASFSNTHLPGSYRYYSSSHPDEKNQGQRKLVIDQTAQKVYVTEGPEPLPNPITAEGFVRSPRVRTGGVVPEAEFGDIQVRAGMKIVRPGTLSSTVVTPTKDITVLSMAEHSVTRKTKETVQTQDPTFEFKRGVLEKDITKSLFSDAQKQEINPGDPDTGDGGTKMGDLYTDKVNAIKEALQESISGPDANEIAAFISSTGTTNIAEAGAIPTLTLNEKLTDPFSVFGLEEELTAVAKWAGGIGIPNLLAKARKAAGLLAAGFADVAAAIFQERFTSLVLEHGSPNEPNVENSEAKNRDFKELMDDWRKLTRKLSGIPVPAAVYDTKGVEEGEANTNLYSPVFPVSDHRGYDVVGSYGYGRGLTVESGGTLDRLLAETDAFRFVDLNDIDEFVRSLHFEATENSPQGRASVQGLDVKTMARIATDAGLDFAPSEQQMAEIQDGSEIGNRMKDQLESDFKNWAADSLDAPLKATPGNAAFSLGELQVFANKKACECRGSESDISLVAFGQDGFIPVAPNLDKATQADAQRRAQQGQTWAELQQAYRGQILDRRNTALRPSNIRDAFTNSAALEQAQQNLADRQDRFDD